MYGVPENLELRIRGQELVEIRMSANQVQFRFDSIHFFVEGEWSIHDAEGDLIANSNQISAEEPTRAHALLSKKVSDYSSTSQKLSLIFETGETLEFLDSNREFESFSIEPMGIVV